MSETHIKYQNLSRQEALAIEREVEGQIAAAFMLGMEVQAAHHCDGCMLDDMEPVSEMDH